MSARLRTLTIVLSALTYFASMALPLGEFAESRYIGLVGFLFGSASLFDTLATDRAALLFVVWLANPLYWIGVSLLRYDSATKATTLGILSVVFAMLDIRESAGIFGRFPAFWVWLGSFAIFALGSALCVATEYCHDSIAVTDDRLGLAVDPVPDERIQGLQ